MTNRSLPHKLPDPAAVRKCWEMSGNLKNGINEFSVTVKLFISQSQKFLIKYTLRWPSWVI